MHLWTYEPVHLSIHFSPACKRKGGLDLHPFFRRMPQCPAIVSCFTCRQHFHCVRAATKLHALPLEPRPTWRTIEVQTQRTGSVLQCPHIAYGEYIHPRGGVLSALGRLTAWMYGCGVSVSLHLLVLCAGYSVWLQVEDQKRSSLDCSLSSWMGVSRGNPGYSYS